MASAAIRVSLKSGLGAAASDEPIAQAVHQHVCLLPWMARLTLVECECLEKCSVACGSGAQEQMASCSNTNSSYKFAFSAGSVSGALVWLSLLNHPSKYTVRLHRQHVVMLICEK